MAWLILIIAGVFEVIWAFTMKQSEGVTRFWPSLITLVTMFASFGLLSWSMRVLPLGTAYTVWTGAAAHSQSDRKLSVRKACAVYLSWRSQ